MTTFSLSHTGQEARVLLGEQAGISLLDTLIPIVNTGGTVVARSLSL